MLTQKSTLLWRISFDRRGNIVANGKHPVGRVTWVQETEICLGTFMWNGNFIERYAKPEGATRADSAEERQRLAKVALLKELLRRMIWVWASRRNSPCPRPLHSPHGVVLAIDGGMGQKESAGLEARRWISVLGQN